MFKNILAFFLATILILGCGGGGGGGSTVPRRPAILPELPLQTPAHAPQAPIVDFDGSLHIGPDVAPAKERIVETGARNGVSVSSGRVRDGAGARDVIDYLHPRTTGGSAVGLRTFQSRRSSASPWGRAGDSRITRFTPFKSSTRRCRTIKGFHSALFRHRILRQSSTCRKGASSSSLSRRRSGLMKRRTHILGLRVKGILSARIHEREGER